MIDTSNLQQTVAAAQQAFARTGEEHVRSRKNLAGLINIVEENLREKRVALAQNETERERMIRDYGHLRHMLHALVKAIEIGPRKGLVSLPAPAEAGVKTGTRISLVPQDLVPQDLVPAEAGTDTGARIRLVPQDPVANGAGPERTVGEGSPELRAGLKRLIKKKRAQASKAGKPEKPAPTD